MQHTQCEDVQGLLNAICIHVIDNALHTDAQVSIKGNNMYFTHADFCAHGPISSHRTANAHNLFNIIIIYYNAGEEKSFIFSSSRERFIERCTGAHIELGYKTYIWLHVNEQRDRDDVIIVGIYCKYALRVLRIYIIYIYIYI